MDSSTKSKKAAKSMSPKYKCNAATKGHWTAHEDFTIALQHCRLGNRWSLISKALPAHRADNDVKNRWFSTLRSKGVNKKASFLYVYARAAEGLASAPEESRAQALKSVGLRWLKSFGSSHDAEMAALLRKHLSSGGQSVDELLLNVPSSPQSGESDCSGDEDAGYSTRRADRHTATLPREGSGASACWHMSLDSLQQDPSAPLLGSKDFTTPSLPWSSIAQPLSTCNSWPNDLNRNMGNSPTPSILSDLAARSAGMQHSLSSLGPLNAPASISGGQQVKSSSWLCEPLGASRSGSCPPLGTSPLPSLPAPPPIRLGKSNLGGNSAHTHTASFVKHEVSPNASFRPGPVLSFCQQLGASGPGSLSSNSNFLDGTDSPRLGLMLQSVSTPTSLPDLGLGLGVAIGQVHTSPSAAMPGHGSSNGCSSTQKLLAAGMDPNLLHYAMQGPLNTPRSFALNEGVQGLQSLLSSPDITPRQALLSCTPRNSSLLSCSGSDPFSMPAGNSSSWSQSTPGGMLASGSALRGLTLPNLLDMCPGDLLDQQTQALLRSSSAAESANLQSQTSLGSLLFDLLSQG